MTGRYSLMAKSPIVAWVIGVRVSLVTGASHIFFNRQNIFIQRFLIFMINIIFNFFDILYYTGMSIGDGIVIANNYFAGYFLDFFFFNYYLGVDNISLVFCVLVFTISPLILLGYVGKPGAAKHSLFILFFSFMLILAFTTFDLFVFFVVFELILVPTFIYIHFGGSRPRKVKAGFLVLFFTIFGSIFMLFSCFLVWSEFGTTNLLACYSKSIPLTKQLFIWFFLFLSLAVKIPIFPFHVWLPEAHVEAPTEGSILLAAFILKLGGYGVLRFLLPLTADISFFVAPLVYFFCILGVIYASLTALRQVDIKKVIAYSSIAHMNLGVLGLYSLTSQGLSGFFFLMVSHAYISSALFFCAGVLYDRFGTKIVTYYGGLVQLMPIFSLFFFYFLLANFSLPGTAGFISEVLLLYGLAKSSSWVFLLCGLGGFIITSFSIVLADKILFGTLKSKNYLGRVSDITRREFFVLFWYFFFSTFLGLFPNQILGSLKYIEYLHVFLVR